MNLEIRHLNIGNVNEFSKRFLVMKFDCPLSHVLLWGFVYDRLIVGKNKKNIDEFKKAFK